MSHSFCRLMVRKMKIKEFGYLIDTGHGTRYLDRSVVISARWDGVRCVIDTYEDGIEISYEVPTEWVSLVVDES